MEIWKDIQGYEGLYQVSNLGNVKSIKARDGLILKPFSDKHKYLKVKLSKHTYRLHRLVAMTFIPNPENKKEVNHINGIKTDNIIENLEWVTASENIKHAFKLGLKDFKNGKSPSCKLNLEQVSLIRTQYLNGIKQSNIAKSLNISPQLINQIVRNKIWNNVSI